MNLYKVEIEFKIGMNYQQHSPKRYFVIAEDSYEAEKKAIEMLEKKYDYSEVEIYKHTIELIASEGTVGQPYQLIK